LLIDPEMTWNLYDKSGKKSVDEVLTNQYNAIVEKERETHKEYSDHYIAEIVNEKMTDFLLSIKGYGASDTENIEILEEKIHKDFGVLLNNNNLIIN